MEAKENQYKLIVSLVLLTLTFLLFVYFLKSADITLQSFLDLSKIEQTVNKLVSLNLLLFSIFFSLHLSLLVVFCKFLKKEQIYFVGVISSIINIILTAIFFYNFSIENLVIYLFYLISIMIIIESANTGFLELKKMVYLRNIANSVSKGGLILAIGILISCIIVTQPNNDKYVKNFESFLIELTKSAQEKAKNETIDVVVYGQKELLRNIIESTEYRMLKDKQDLESMAFVEYLEKTNEYINSDEYKKYLIDQANKGEQLSEKLDVIERLKRIYPIIEVFEKNLWLILSFMTASLFFSFYKTIIWILSAIWGVIFTIIIKILKLEEKTATA